LRQARHRTGMTRREIGIQQQHAVVAGVVARRFVKQL
jgi:hypothetical protein